MIENPTVVLGLIATAIGVATPLFLFAMNYPKTYRRMVNVLGILVAVAGMCFASWNEGVIRMKRETLAVLPPESHQVIIDAADRQWITWWDITVYVALPFMLVAAIEVLTFALKHEKQESRTEKHEP